MLPCRVRCDQIEGGGEQSRCALLLRSCSVRTPQGPPSLLVWHGVAFLLPVLKQGFPFCACRFPLRLSLSVLLPPSPHVRLCFPFTSRLTFHPRPSSPRPSQAPLLSPLPRVGLVRMSRSNSRPGLPETASGEEIEWEMRPGGMLVQRREDASGPAGPMIRIKVSHGSYQHGVTVPAQSTFGELKKVLAQETGLEPQEQRLLFRGKEKEDDDCLHMAGVKDLSKVILMEDPASKERKLEEMKRNQGIAKACAAVHRVQVEVDKLARKVSALESTVHRGTKVAEKEFVVLTELLMRQILQLDSIEAEGEAKVQRRIEVRRVQNLVDTLDTMKARNANPFSSSSKAVSVTTQWETFESGVGSLSAPPPRAASAQITQGWEHFD